MLYLVPAEPDLNVTSHCAVHLSEVRNEDRRHVYPGVGAQGQGYGYSPRGHVRQFDQTAHAKFITGSKECIWEGVFLELV